MNLESCDCGRLAALRVAVLCVALSCRAQQTSWGSRLRGRQLRVDRRWDAGGLRPGHSEVLREPLSQDWELTELEGLFLSTLSTSATAAVVGLDRNLGCGNDHDQ